MRQPEMGGGPRRLESQSYEQVWLSNPFGALLTDSNGMRYYMM